MCFLKDTREKTVILCIYVFIYVKNVHYQKWLRKREKYNESKCRDICTVNYCNLIMFIAK